LSVKIAPWSELFRTAAVPWCASMIFFTMARPGSRRQFRHSYLSKTDRIPAPADRLELLDRGRQRSRDHPPALLRLPPPRVENGQRHSRQDFGSRPRLRQHFPVRRPAYRCLSGQETSTRGGRIRDRQFYRCRLRQFYTMPERRWRTRPHNRPRPPRAPPTNSIHMGLSRVTSIITAAARVTAAVRHPVSAARAITVPLAMTSPITTGTRPRRTICCHGVSRNLSHIR